MYLDVFIALITSFVATFFLTPRIITIAHRCNILDNPDGRLKTHSASVAYLGGVAVYGGFITALTLVAPVDGIYPFFLIGLTFLLCVGLMDDLLPMLPGIKFFWQIVATLCFLKGGLYNKSAFFASLSPFLSFIYLFASGFWILTCINAFNLIDVMDGLATTVAINATATFLCVALLLHNFSVALVLAAFLGALVAFLFYNKPPARIYLGDAGSIFIGGFMAIIPFMLSWGGCSMYGYCAPLIILAIPLLEVGGLILIRLYKGIPFYLGSRDHFSHYLQKKGWSRELILFFVTGIAFLLACGALIVLYGLISPVYIFFSGILFGVSWFSFLLT